MENTSTFALTTAYKELPTSAKNITINSTVNTLLYFGKDEPTASSSHIEIKPHVTTSFTTDVPVYVKGTSAGNMVVSLGVLFKQAPADSSGGGTGGVTVHNLLTGRSVANQHPALAIHTDDLTFTNIQGDDLKENLESLDTLIHVKGKTTSADISVDATSFKTVTGDNVQSALTSVDTELSKTPTTPTVTADDVTADDTAFNIIKGSTVQELLKSTDDVFNSPVTAADVSLDTSKLHTFKGTNLQLMVEEADTHVTIDNTLFGTLTKTDINSLFVEIDQALTQSNINYSILSGRVTALENP